MTVFWSIIAWAVMLPVLPIVYFMQKNECKPKKNIIVGVTLPYEAQGLVAPDIRDREYGAYCDRPGHIVRYEQAETPDKQAGDHRRQHRPAHPPGGSCRRF